MQIVVAGGHGQIAMLLHPLLLGRGHQVTGLIRNPDHAGDVRRAGAEPVLCDLEAEADPAEAVAAHPEASLEYNVNANEVFVKWSSEGFSALEAAGMQFLTWPGRDDLARFVFGHTTTLEDTNALIDALQAIA